MIPLQTIDQLENIRTIRRALLIGLDAYAEIDRLDDVYCSKENANQPFDKHLRPTHTTGDDVTYALFAQALRTLGNLEPKLTA